MKFNNFISVVKERMKNNFIPVVIESMKMVFTKINTVYYFAVTEDVKSHTREAIHLFKFTDILIPFEDVNAIKL